MMWNQNDFTTWQATWTTLAFRLPLIWMQSLNPTPEGQKEMARMVAEKQQAAIDGIHAAQRQLMNQWFSLWSRPMAQPTVEPSVKRVSEAALAPARRTVKANAKRLRKL